MIKIESQTEVDVAALRQWLEEGEAVEILDIRPRADYEAWHIPGSSNLEAYEALQQDDYLPFAGYQPGPAQVVVVVCYRGNTSQKAASYLRSRGLPALSLIGGMQAWSLAWNTAFVPIKSNLALVLQVRRTGKGCLSYLVGSRGEALVIDPSLEPQVYLDLAARSGLRITRVLDTHIHADHMSRALGLLAHDPQIRYYLPVQRRASFPYLEVREGDEIEIGSARLRAYHTPGHTGESMSFLFEEGALFTGDTLFLDSVGRPDLNATRGEAQIRASLLFKSLRRLKSFSPQTLILPAHTGSPVPFDGVPLAARLGEVIRRVAAMEYSEEKFVDWIISRIPPTPHNYERILQINEAGVLPELDLAGLEVGANRCAV